MAPGIPVSAFARVASIVVALFAPAGWGALLAVDSEAAEDARLPSDTPPRAPPAESSQNIPTRKLADLTARSPDRRARNGRWTFDIVGLYGIAVAVRVQQRLTNANRSGASPCRLGQ